MAIEKKVATYKYYLSSPRKLQKRLDNGWKKATDADRKLAGVSDTTGLILLKKEG